MALYRRVKKKIRKIAKRVKDIFITPEKAVILIYHRVCNLSSDPQLLAVSPQRFEAQIKYLKENYNVLSLQQLVQHLKVNKVPNNAVVVTFDDGYADNLYYAKPILEKYNVPATVFVTAGFIGQICEYWWDELERILLENETYKPLSIEVGQAKFRWNITNESDLTEVYKVLVSALKDIPTQVRDEKIAELRAWAGLNHVGRDTHRSMTAEEIRQLADGELIEIGAHTMSHCVLSAETLERQQWEIVESKKILESMLGQPVNSFSYPFGLLSDFSPETAKIVEETGFNCGIANEQAGIEFDWDLYKLPRRLVRNWDINLFQDQLNYFFQRKPSLFTGLKNKWLVFTLPRKVYKHSLLPCVKRYPVQKNALSEQGAPSFLRILHVNTVDNKGGAAKIAHSLFEHIKNTGHQSDMLVDRIVTNNDDANIILRDYSKEQRLLWYAQNNIGWQDFFHLASFKIKDIEQFKRCDILHIHNLHSGYFSYFALPELSALKPTVWTLHDMHAITGHCASAPDCDQWISGCENCPDLDRYPAIKKDTAAFLWQNKQKIYENSDFTIVCPSLWLKKKVEKSILKDKEIHLIPNGIDNTVFFKQEQEKLRQHLGLPLDKKILLFCAEGGSQNYWKGSKYLLKAYEILKIRDDVLFLNIGGQETVKKDRWLDIPYIYDEKTLAQYYGAADLFIYPSLADNLPLVVLEAMACGTPVVAFEVGGIPEIINHLATGYLARYKDEGDFIEGILHFLDNPDLIIKAGHRASLEIGEKYSLQRMLNSYLGLYEKLLKK